MITRYDVMVYSAMIGAFCALAAGFLKDVEFPFTALALAVIAVCSLITGAMAYLHVERS